MSTKNMPSNNVVANGGNTMYTEVKFNAMFNQYTPQIIVDNFGNLRGFIRNNDGSIWFIGHEIASMIGYKDPWVAIKRLVSSNQKMVINLKELTGVLTVNSTELTGDSPVNSYPMGNQNRILISEQGLYELCTQSELKNPQITEFREWVYNTIVQMRQTGISMSDQMRQSIENANNMDELKRLALEQNQQLIAARHKIDYYDRMMDDDQHTLPISMIAAELGTTAQELNTFLIYKGFHRRMGFSSNYIPRREYIDMDLVKVRKKEHKDLDGNTIISDYTVGYTEKGREFIMNLYHNTFHTMISDTQMRYANQVPPPVVNNNFFMTDPSMMIQMLNTLQRPQSVNPNQQIIQQGQPDNCPIQFVDQETRTKYRTYQEYLDHMKKNE